MEIEFVASVAVITPDPAESHKLYLDALGLPLEQRGEAYLATEQLDGVKHLGIWPLAEAAQACFGSEEWPAEHPVPQASIEFEVVDAAAVDAAGDELAARGFRLVHPARKEPWGQTVARLISAEGLIIGISHTPGLRGDG